jgi:hypothetical protein
VNLVAKGLEVTGTILPFSAAVRGVIMDAHPFGNMRKVPLDEGDSSANGGNAKEMLIASMNDVSENNKIKRV